MCIIIAKPTGIALPSKKILENCFIANHDGAGFMFNHNDRVYIYKGFMSFSHFYEIFKATSEKYDFKNKGLVIHFRISTAGNVDEGNCHPYPISKRDEDLRNTNIITKDVGMVHNGIIHLFSGKDNYLNDTQLFIKNIVSAFYEVNSNFYLDKDDMKILEIIADSKLCFLDKNGELHMIGRYIKDKGIYYSNQSYKEKTDILTESHKKEKKLIFEDLFFKLDDEIGKKHIKDKDFDNLIKKVIYLEENEFVFSKNKDRVYEGSDKYKKYAYDNDLNLYKIQLKEKIATIIEVGIEF